MKTVFIRALEADDKATSLHDAIIAPDLARNTKRFEVELAEFARVPGSPLSYWVPSTVRDLFIQMPQLETNRRIVRQGGVTGDDSRFLRSTWEVPASGHSRPHWRWVPFAKGGPLSRWYSDFPVMVVWDDERGTFGGYTGLLHRPSERPSSADHYFKPALTWPLRAAKFAPVPLPSGCIFSIRGYGLIAPEHELLAISAIGNSRLFDYLFKVALGRFGFPEFVVGVLQKLPFPELDERTIQSLNRLAREAWSLRRSLDSCNETSRAFSIPALLQVDGRKLADRVTAWSEHTRAVQTRLDAIQAEVDMRCYDLYDLDDGTRRTVEEEFGSAREEVHPRDGEELEGESDSAESNSGRHAVRSAELISWTVGVIVGRFDIRLGLGTRSLPPEPDPFDSLPIHLPAMLPPGELTQNYPIVVDPDGVLVDDPNHPEDIVRRTRDVLVVLFKERAGIIEAEACQMLSVKDLRTYFSSPRQFFIGHIHQYSKGRRKAPIYWLLQSPKASYGLWLYYHRLNRDTLFKALTLYLEPKIRLEESQIEALRLQRAGTAPSGKETRDAEKAMERANAVLADLHEFQARLKRAADLNLVPDLNDGVVLTMAPLWELVPWKEPKAYWEDLLQGKYEWSSIGQQLREKGMVRS